jgi:hypothetical protein
VGAHEDTGQVQRARIHISSHLGTVDKGADRSATASRRQILGSVWSHSPRPWPFTGIRGPLPVVVRDGRGPW